MRNLDEQEKLPGSHVKKILFACRDAICANYPAAGFVPSAAEAAEARTAMAEVRSRLEVACPVIFS